MRELAKRADVFPWLARVFSASSPLALPLALPGPRGAAISGAISPRGGLFSLAPVVRRSGGSA